MKQKLRLFTSLLLLAVASVGWAQEPLSLFHETFGNNSGSARPWDDSYSVKSGVAAVYSGITGYTVTNVKQGKNTTGSTGSGLNQSAQGDDAVIVIGPLNVATYKSLTLKYQWKAASTKGTYSTTAYFATSEKGSYTPLVGTGDGATTFVERSYSLPESAQVSTLYLKIVWNTSNTQAIIDEVDLSGIASGGSAIETKVNVVPNDHVTAVEMWYFDADIVDIEDGDEVAEGTVVYVLPTAETGYTVESVTVVDASNNPVEVTKNTGNWSFYMPNSSVTINVAVTQGSTPPVTGDNYELFSGNLVEGDYIIYYDGKAMNTTVESDRLQYEEVSPTGNVITTENAAIVWHIAKSGDYWTIYNAEANAYAAGTGARNKAQMLGNGTDDKALWTVSGTETYEFVNKKNAANSVNANLRNNGTYGFACYATGTGGALSLYKKVESVTVGQFGYTTYVTKNNVAIPEGVEVYIVTAIYESSIHMEPVTGTIPANEPIIVRASSGEYRFPIAESATDISGNLLRASDGDVTGDGSTIYALGRGKEGDAKDKVGFYRVKSGATVPAGKAYLDTSVGAKDFLNFDFGETDGIGQIEMGQTSNAEIYNLSGQKVNKAQKGIYIVNGKKVVIR